MFCKSEITSPKDVGKFQFVKVKVLQCAFIELVDQCLVQEIQGYGAFDFVNHIVM